MTVETVMSGHRDGSFGAQAARIPNCRAEEEATMKKATAALVALVMGATLIVTGCSENAGKDSKKSQ
ncbi:hypothetical protein [Streptomyces sp. NPDC005760]|uniref:hypothetical protein n=1 Tax=Streptomyces sp. NPDC005760 TaxID=3156718 RepID=UPI0033F787EF